MKVLGGKEGGRRLRSVPNNSVRPTTARVKKSLFDMILVRFDIEGWRVLDLFGGSGSLGIEALSRGAGRVVFVEKAHKTIVALRQNLKELGLTEKADIVRSDVIDYLRTLSATPTALPFDLIFCDPPYKFDQWPEIFEYLPRDAILVVESDRAIELPPQWKAFRSKSYGRTVVALVCYEEGEGDSLGGLLD